MCHVLCVTFFGGGGGWGAIIVKLYGVGSVINGCTPSSYVSELVE